MDEKSGKIVNAERSFDEPPEQLTRERRLELCVWHPAND
jgi:hypothetical protein